MSHSHFLVDNSAISSNAICHIPIPDFAILSNVIRHILRRYLYLNQSKKMMEITVKGSHTLNVDNEGGNGRCTHEIHSS